MSAEHRRDSLGAFHAGIVRLRERKRIEAVMSRIAMFCQPTLPNPALIERMFSSEPWLRQHFERAFGALAPQDAVGYRACWEAAGPDAREWALWAGLDALHALVAQVSALSAEKLQAQAVAVGALAKLCQKRVPGTDEAVVVPAALTAHMGVAVLAMLAPDTYPKLLSSLGGTSTQLYEIEMRTLGTTHAEVGALAAREWGFPLSVVQAVADHHGDWRNLPPNSLAVFAGECLAHPLGYDGGLANIPASPPDALLAGLRIADSDIGQLAECALGAVGKARKMTAAVSQAA